MDRNIVIDLSDTHGEGIEAMDGWDEEWKPRSDWIDEISLSVHDDMGRTRKSGWKQSLSRIKFHASGNPQDL